MVADDHDPFGGPSTQWKAGGQERLSTRGMSLSCPSILRLARASVARGAYLGGKGRKEALALPRRNTGSASTRCVRCSWLPHSEGKRVPAVQDGWHPQ